jgi:hypothetical protein
MTTQLSIRQSLNKAFRKLTIARASFETFRSKLGDLLAGVAAKPDESEEHYKNLLASFFVQTFYPASRQKGDDGEVWAINTSDRIDLTIARQVGKGKATTEEIGVLFEVKKPKNTAEMPTANRLNVKALQQLLYYFLQERLTRKNVRIRHLVITNIHEWFVFDARTIEALFVRDRQLVKDFEDFEAGRLSYRKTEAFYKNAAAAAIARHSDKLEYTYFNLLECASYLESEGEDDRKRLIDLYKVFAPEHLFGLPFANDSNSLNQAFYRELLHILGLAEQKQKNQKLIERLPLGQRHSGSLLENTIIQIERLKKLDRLPPPPEDEEITRDEHLFRVALGLVITWLNRILFLKLLEAQLLTYHAGDRTYKFLTIDRVSDYQELSTLFFGVLAHQSVDRSPTVAKFAAIPYLNSSLFELTELEHETISIDALSNSQAMTVSRQTVLQDANGNARQGEINPLRYLFEFLDAYDFSSEGEGAINERPKSLISASVLGKIFEKINGYRDGSFFTPGYVTMHMCRDTLQRAVIQKFNEQIESISARTFEDLKEDIKEFVKHHDQGRAAARLSANAVIADIKVCDPSVGSGHFLVSVLNELIAIKSELGILCDQAGNVLGSYEAQVEEDELVVIHDQTGELFVYRPQNQKSLAIQKALFEEKRRIIENCLFGVDINENSVAICQLRLWIELLKHAYYTDTDLKNLETLPNIDINIKCGNSVIYQYALRPNDRADIKGQSQIGQDIVTQYKSLVASYYETRQSKEKNKIKTKLAKIKQSVSQGFPLESEAVKRRTELEKELAQIRDQRLLFDDETDRKEREKAAAKLEVQIAKLTDEIEEYQSGRMFEKALEWRFEFPEVLDAEGDFVGFDVIIGNPPYVRQEAIKSFKPYLKELFSTYTGVADLFVYFYELGLRLLKPGGHLTFISSNKYFRAGYGEKLRGLLSEETTIANLIDFGDYPVFEEAIAYPSIITLRKGKPAAGHGVRALSWDASRSDDVTQFPAVLASAGLVVRQSELKRDGWRLESGEVLDLLAKLRGAGVPLGEYVEGRFYYGIKTGFNEAFVVDRVTRDRLVEEDARSVEVLKPYLRGRDVKRWVVSDPDLWLIFTRRGTDIDQYPAIKKYLEQFKERLMPGTGRKAGSYEWFEIQDNVAYWQEFEGQKIIYPDISSSCIFSVDNENFYPDCTLFLIPSSSLLLSGILNSSLNSFFFPQICPRIRGGFMRFKSIYVEQIPIPDPKKDPDRVTQIETLVQQILDQKQTNPTADVSQLEQQIDRHVYQLYDLTDDEIAIVEAAT